ncbi:hypothetical protein AGMMS49949_03230 [Alphaproteobacteria bacterium]|nr:hypothetical protein AGMMS49949_03230 [Alphaproteobacteria bacterium]GHS97377.1 hypothetical protein AGMMS50296_4320 [Alphaproteobacteria bacterium]
MFFCFKKLFFCFCSALFCVHLSYGSKASREAGIQALQETHAHGFQREALEPYVPKLKSFGEDLLGIVQDKYRVDASDWNQIRQVAKNMDPDQRMTLYSVNLEVEQCKTLSHFIECLLADVFDPAVQFTPQSERLTYPCSFEALFQVCESLEERYVVDRGCLLQKIG